MGYRQPPTATRFRAGTSGNPKGRPKGSRGITSILQEALRQKIPVNEAGRPKRLQALEVMIRRLTNDAMRGDQRAIKLLMAFYDRYGGTPEAGPRLPEMLAEDERILREYLREPPGPVIDIPKALNEDDADDS